MELTQLEIDYITISIKNGHDFAQYAIKSLAEKHICSQTSIWLEYIKWMMA